jgi:NAD(P)H-dependent FMN reductase
MTPLLKNAIDWATRADENPLIGKVAGIVSASPGNFGGIRSQTLARQLLTHLGCHVVPVTCVLPQADQAFDDAGKLKEERHRKSVRTLAEALVRTAERLK